MTKPAIAVHQVMATLGYGDAIGNEALGIQRVLRQAGYESRIYVETVDPPLEDRTLDYRDLIDDSDADNILIHHFSIGSRASRVAFALPDRMILVYHNITPAHYFLDARPRSPGNATAAGGSSGPTLRVATSRSGIQSSTRPISTRSGSAVPACCRSSRTSRI